jgi:hypothetical protein
MRCSTCGYELDENGKCQNCSSEAAKVHVMSQEEKDGYNGVTIEETSSGRSHFKEEPKSGNRKIYINTFGLGNSNWLVKVSLFVLVVAILAFVVFVALPVILVGAAIGIIVWLILSFIRH